MADNSMNNSPIVPPWPSCVNLTTWVQGMSDYEIICWIVQQLNRVNDRITGLVDEAVEQANAYTDEQLQSFRNEFNALENDIYAAMGQLSDQQQQFINTATQQINAINERVDGLSSELEAAVNGMRTYTDQAILDNNELLYKYIEDSFIDIHVIDYFTGLSVTIQQMFDKLAQFHLQNPLTYNQIAGREVTYNEISALNITYTEMITNAGGVLPS